MKQTEYSSNDHSLNTVTLFFLLIDLTHQQQDCLAVQPLYAILEQKL